MDGRAQAAYNHDKFRLWQEIKFGGPTFDNAVRKHGSVERAERKLNNKERTEIGKWVDKQLKKHKAWVVIMPTTQMNSAFVQGLLKTPNWIIAYMDDDQHLFIDTDTPKGKQLQQSIINETAVFPTDYSKYLTTSSNLLKSTNPEDLAKAYNYAAQAWDGSTSFRLGEFPTEEQAEIACEDYVMGVPYE